MNLSFQPPEEDDPRDDDQRANALLPCPFCGNAKNIAVVNEKHDHSGGYYIACPVCDASTGLRFACGVDPAPLLIEQWNRRAALATKPPAGEQKPVGYVATVDLGKPVSMAIYSPEEFHSWPNKRLVEEGHYVPLYLAQQPEQVEQVEQDDGPADCPNCDGGRFCSKRACNEPDAARARGEGQS